MNQTPNEHDKLPEINTDETAETVDIEEVTEAADAEQDIPVKKRKKGPNRKLRYGATATALTAVVIAGVILLNVVVGILNDRYPLNLDLTADKEFTLSEESVKVAQSVKDDVEVVVFRAESNYSSPNYGSDDLDGVIRQFYEAMKQYGVRSGGKVSIQYFDATANPTKVAQYEKYEPDENTILFLSGERSAKLAMTDLFKYDETSYMYYGSLVVTEPLVEKAIATSILKVSGSLAPVLIFTGHGESEESMQAAESLLDLNGYETVRHDLTTEQEITTDAMTAILAAPTTDFGDEEILRLRNWLQNDGFYNRHLVVFASQTKSCPNLNEFLTEEYGIEIMDDVALETNSSNYYMYPYYAYGDIAESDLTGDFTDQRVLSLFTRRLTLHKDNDNTKSLYNVPLVTFGKTAKLLPPDADTVDQAKDADTYPIVGAAYAHKVLNGSAADGVVESYVAVFGSEAFLNNYLLTYVSNAENGDMFMSVFNTFSGSSDTVTISARSVTQNTITLDSGTQTLVGIIIFTIALPLGTLLIGLIVFLKRRHL